MEKSLQPSEWIVLFSFLAVFCALVFFTQMKISKISSCLSAEIFEKHELISVTIQGAVYKPGVYPVSPGTSLEKVIKKSRPKKNVDLKSIDLNQKIEAPIELFLKEKEKIIVWIVCEGKEPEPLELPIGSRFSDLKSKINPDLYRNSDLLKLRRQLRDGEKIFLGTSASNSRKSCEIE